MKHTKQSGFTLVELAIVLVIIGLIVGGVLVGQDLIKAAEIRNATAQIEKYNTAATAFRTKYDGIPGDLQDARAASFQLTNGGDGSDGLSDGDGLLENGPTAANKIGIGGETDLFWVHLTQAQFIPEAFNTATGAVGGALATPAAVVLRLPSLKLRETAQLHAVAMLGRNQFYLANITQTAASGVPAAANDLAAVSPIEAENIDSKVDDGAPALGIVRVFTSITNANADTAPAGTDACVTVTAGNPTTYRLDAASNAVVGCRLRWRTSF